MGKKKGYIGLMKFVNSVGKGDNLPLGKPPALPADPQALTVSGM